MAVAVDSDVVIVDYGVGNVGSILNMLRYCGARAVISSSPDDIRQARRLILPGVGSFDRGMSMLRERDLIELLTEMVMVDKIPTLGICLGLQLFARRSEEGAEAGLGWLGADSVRFRFEAEGAGRKIPHMGWNTVSPSGVTRVVSASDRFYFAHSYHVVVDDPAHVVGMTTYGYPFASVVRRDNLLGVQFHPEKSHRFGMAVLGRFAGV